MEIDFDYGSYDYWLSDEEFKKEYEAWYDYHFNNKE